MSRAVARPPSFPPSREGGPRGSAHFVESLRWVRMRDTDHFRFHLSKFIASKSGLRVMRGQCILLLLYHGWAACTKGIGLNGQNRNGKCCYRNEP